MRSILFLFYLCAFAKAYPTFSQEKIEREYSIDNTAVPQVARDFVRAFASDQQIKWIKEENENGTNIEAKFKENGSRYSIEFSSDGAVEDLEVTVPFKTLPDEVKERIDAYFKAHFKHYKVEKTQEQYVASKQELLHWRTADNNLKTLKPQYEIVVKTRNSGEKAKRYELLFDTNGTFLKRATVGIRSDNILRF